MGRLHSVPFFPPLPTEPASLGFGGGPGEKLEIRQDSCAFLSCQAKNLPANPHIPI